MLSLPNIVGDPLNTNVMIVGQNPGFPDAGKPNPHKAFFGHSYTCELVQRCIDGFDNIYLTNIVKCAKKLAWNDNHAISCVDKYLERELDYIKPTHVICLGRKAEEIMFVLSEDSCFGFVVRYFTHPGALKRACATKVAQDEYVETFRNYLKTIY